MADDTDDDDPFRDWLRERQLDPDLILPSQILYQSLLTEWQESADCPRSKAEQIRMRSRRIRDRDREGAGDGQGY